MTNKAMPGSEVVCAVLEWLGVEMVFSIPGIQTVALFEALRRSSLRTLLTGSEGAAAFAAEGYFRAGGKVAAVSTIPGPGFTNALTGLAEARHDSAALIMLVVRSTAHETRRFRLQETNLRRIAEPLVKQSFRISSTAQIAPVLAEAYSTALWGEPGPVLVEIDDTALSKVGPLATVKPATPVFDVDEGAFGEIAKRLARAQRPLLFCGQGAAAAAESIRVMAERYVMPVVTTGSGRGVIAEDHPLSLRYDFSGGAWRELNRLTAECNLLLAVGCKFTHNGSGGFKLEMAPDKLVHADASTDVLGANYPAEIKIKCDAGLFLNKLGTAAGSDEKSASQWKPEELQQWRRRFASEMEAVLAHVPPLNGVASADCSDLFKALRRKLPRDTILVTDSGYHQVLARTFWEAWSPRGLLTPSDFQSMGFGLPAAIGAALACPDRRVVAVVGDGGLIMSGMELLTAVREKVPLTVLLLNDASLGQIRMEQLRAYGHDHATQLLGPDTSAWCQSMGVNYLRLEGGLDTALDQGLNAAGVTVIEADCSDSPQLRRLRRRGLITAQAKRMLGPGLMARLKRVLGRM